MGEPHAIVEGDHARDEHRRRVALREHPVGLRVTDNGVQPREQSRRQARQALIGLHHVEINVRPQIKHREHALKHRAVLPRRAEHRVHLGRVARQLF